VSYARFSDADVYVYESVYGFFMCQVCLLTPQDEGGWHGDTTTNTRMEMVTHLRAHREAGHDTGAAIDRLEAEIAQGEPEPREPCRACYEHDRPVELRRFNGAVFCRSCFDKAVAMTPQRGPQAPGWADGEVLP